MTNGILAELERKLGLPRLSRFADSLQSFPDSQQLKLIKGILEVAERLPKDAEDLDRVIHIIDAIKSIEPGQLQVLEKILKCLERIIKKTPEGVLEFLSKLKED